MLTPYDPPPLQDSNQGRFNASMISTRTMIEQTFDIYKGRWQCMKVGLRYYPEKACRIIMACAVLHNLIKKFNQGPDEADLDYCENYDSDDGEICNEAALLSTKMKRRGTELSEAEIYRDRIANGHFGRK